MTVELLEKSRTALEKALQQSGSVRLVTKGAKLPGLFPSGASRDIAAAIAQCKADGLLSITDVEEKKGKATTQVPSATITRAGALALFAAIDATRRKELLALASPENRALAEDAFIAVSHAELKTAEAALNVIFANEEEIAGQLKAILDHRLSTARATRTRLTQAIEELERDIAAIPTTAPRLPVSEPKVDNGVTRSPITPRDDKDLDFQRDQSEQLVFAWKDASTPEAKELLEGVMFNLGVEQLGERGQQIPFDQTTQEVEELVERGELVEVVEPGWRLSNSRGVYLISKTQVRKIGAI